MNMPNGLAVIEVEGQNSKAVFIDEEALFFARLRASTKKNREEQERKQKEIEDKQRKIAINNYRWRKYTIKTFAKLSLCMAIIIACFTTCFYGLVAPIIAIPVASITIAVGGVKFGTWFNRATNRHRRM